MAKFAEALGKGLVLGAQLGQRDRALDISEEKLDLQKLNQYETSVMNSRAKLKNKQVELVGRLQNLYKRQEEQGTSPQLISEIEKVAGELFNATDNLHTLNSYKYDPEAGIHSIMAVNEITNKTVDKKLSDREIKDLMGNVLASAAGTVATQEFIEHQKSAEQHNLNEMLKGGEYSGIDSKGNAKLQYNFIEMSTKTGKRSVRKETKKVDIDKLSGRQLETMYKLEQQEILTDKAREAINAPTREQLAYFKDRLNTANNKIAELIIEKMHNVKTADGTPLLDRNLYFYDKESGRIVQQLANEFSLEGKNTSIAIAADSAFQKAFADIKDEVLRLVSERRSKGLSPEKIDLDQIVLDAFNNKKGWMGRFGVDLSKAKAVVEEETEEFNKLPEDEKKKVIKKSKPEKEKSLKSKPTYSPRGFGVIGTKSERAVGTPPEEKGLPKSTTRKKQSTKKLTEDEAIDRLQKRKLTKSTSEFLVEQYGPEVATMSAVEIAALLEGKGDLIKKKILK